MAEKLSCCIQHFPTEILVQIFAYLPAVKVVNIRRVCTRWKDVIDSMMNESFWLQYCVQDYKHMLNTIRHRIPTGISYFSLYKSFRLWPVLSESIVIKEEFTPQCKLFQQIEGFCLLRNNIIGVHNSIGITYYDIQQNFTKLEQKSIMGTFQRYVENIDVILLHKLNNNDLKLIYKKFRNPNITMPKVTHFLLTDNEIWYVKKNTYIYVRKYHETQSSTYIGKLYEDIYCVGYNETLYLVTVNASLFKIQGQNIIFECSLKNSPSIMHTLNQYNLLEYVYSDCKSKSIPLILDRKDLCCIYIYGDIVFVGSKWGVLQIYYKPYIDGVFDIYNSEPVKELYLVASKSQICRNTQGCYSPISAIGVVEGVEKHTVFVAVPETIFFLNIIHIFLFI